MTRLVWFTLAMAGIWLVAEQYFAMKDAIQ